MTPLQMAIERIKQKYQQMGQGVRDLPQSARDVNANLVNTPVIGNAIAANRELATQRGRLNNEIETGMAQRGAGINQVGMPTGTTMGQMNEDERRLMAERMAVGGAGLMMGDIQPVKHLNLAADIVTGLKGAPLNKTMESVDDLGKQAPRQLTPDELSQYRRNIKSESLNRKIIERAQAETNATIDNSVDNMRKTNMVPNPGTTKMELTQQLKSLEARLRQPNNLSQSEITWLLESKNAIMKELGGKLMNKSTPIIPNALGKLTGK